MRLQMLIAMICLGVCLAYAHYLKPVEVRSECYDGPATFVSLLCYQDEHAEQWILVCGVDGEPVAFNAGDARRRCGAESLRPGQLVRLRYELPAMSTSHRSELGPPTLLGIAPAGLADAADGAVVAAASAGAQWSKD